MEFKIYRTNERMNPHGPIIAGCDAYLCRGCAVDKSKVGKLSIVCESLECTQSEVNNLKKQKRNYLQDVFVFQRGVLWAVHD